MARGLLCLKPLTTPPKDMDVTATKTDNRYADVSLTLKEERDRLIGELLEGNAPNFLEDQARLIDDYFRQSYEKSVVGPKMGIAKNPYAVVALGGYGRAEQCVYSDVDLLFLFEKKVPKEAEELVREIIYPLWDMGLDVGHATRSIKECISMSRKDFEVLTSILDARFICGMSPLFMKLMDQIRTKFINLKPDKIISWLVETNRERHRHFGDSFDCSLGGAVKKPFYSSLDGSVDFTTGSGYGRKYPVDDCQKQRDCQHYCGVGERGVEGLR